ncbi:Lipid-A-disaccharide synthase [Lacunisphaera limnophila]|uniref:Lipid-A-disaccharide synthase n=1 Tax=Lacunisphaera limnophila TaxID=1838286 RepID=A0A1I7PHE6_9BACT|nr:lipid-A-disaccharide synthase [Lacunisphaera limnophila]AOS43025.1 Lipid-A-disaccharide synthase [Lacunisphaera limnophila]
MNRLLHEGLPAPREGAVDLLIVAAEHSGDEHAARMVRGLLAKDPDLKVCALGGPRLAAAGAQLLRDLTGSSAMGFAVIAQISYYRSLIASVVTWVGMYKPRAVCFVDSSGLNLRIAQGLFERGYAAKAGGPTKALYYISPQIWASRAGRRFKMAQHLDGLAAIFPFEPAVYADTALPVEFVGHPFVAPDYMAPVRYDPAGPILLLPGSRTGPVSRIFPVLLAGYRAWGGKRPAVVLYPSDGILGVLQAANPPAGVELRRTSEAGAVAASAVLTSSGTMSMHCALAGIPGVVTYRTDPFTYFIGRLLVKVEHIGIANLLLKEAMYPEYIQGAAKAEVFARELQDCLENPARRERTAAQAARLRALLAQPTAGSAVEWMCRQLG